MEVSGIRQGSDSEVDARVREKLRQVTASDREGFPAYVVVVEFTGPLSRVVMKKLS